MAPMVSRQRTALSPIGLGTEYKLTTEHPTILLIDKESGASQWGWRSFLLFSPLNLLNPRQILTSHFLDLLFSSSYYKSSQFVKLFVPTSVDNNFPYFYRSEQNISPLA